MPVEENEEALVERSKEDPAAFGLLYQRYVGKIYNYVYYRTGNHHDAEDLTARTFYHALSSIGRYQNRGVPFSAWLYRIAHNQVANWHRDRSRRKVVALDELVVTSQRKVGPEGMIEAQEERNALLEIIRKLPPDRQQLLILKFTAGLSNAEIGQVMGRSEGAIKSLYHRTLLALREKFADEMDVDSEMC
ncbi:MAG: sigma-70 family RNA polymerase sigma factor [Chloroflexota bacterium]|nr:sigma-70 family RNA polymerase sigma factor [Chloroflexota bacterium]